MMYGIDAAMSAMIVAHVVFHLALLTLVVLGVVWLVRALRAQPAYLDSTALLRRRKAAGKISDDDRQRQTRRRT